MTRAALVAAAVAAAVAVLVVVLYLAVWRLRRRPVTPEVVDGRPLNAPALEGVSAGTARQQDPGATAAAEDEYRALVTMVLGDRAKAERLVSYEAQQAPGADRPQLIRDALERLRGDRQRYG